MGLDLYAGTLTRYYAHNWKTAVQQWAEQNGYAFHRMAPDKSELPEEESASPDEIRRDMEGWRDQILAAVAQSGQQACAPWPEDNETPYFTDKPDWDAFGAMLLVAACHSYGEAVPATVPKNWDFASHPLIVRLAADQKKIWSLFRGAIWWLPLPQSFLFQAPLPTGDQAVVATTAALRKELEKLNALAWQADEQTVLGWSRTEGYPVDGSIGAGGLFSRAEIPEHTQFDTQSLAKFAYSLFYQTLLFAEENRTPILLDY